LQVLVDNVLAHGSHLQVGGFGVKWLLMALGDGGRADLAYAILNQTDFPSFGYMMSAAANGAENATTAWESWFFSDNTFSHDHGMFTSGSTYFFQSLAGIKLAPDALAANKLTLAPSIPPYASGLTFVNATWDTVAGTVSSAWQWVNASTLALQFTLPPNVQAQLTLPLSKRTLHVGSGSYSFMDTA
jgi:alpha-L-rhamnosidase